MKKLFFWMLVILAISWNGQAQSFLLSNASNVPINFGDTITVTGTGSSALVGEVHVKNISWNVKPVMVLRHQLGMVPGTTSTFAFGYGNYAYNVSVTPNSFNILPGLTDSSFLGRYHHNGIGGTSIIRYNFYDQWNSADSAWVIFKYVYPSTSSIDEPVPDQIMVTPNPVINKFKISTEMGPINIFIYDVLGKFQGLYTSENETTEIDISNLKSGIYFIYIENENGKLTKYSKLIKE